MTARKNPVEKRLETLSALWLQATESAAVRVVVWRIPANAARMMSAFFEAQKHPGAWSTPDFFIRFDQSFETGFGYSRDLKAALLDGYRASADDWKAQGIGLDWEGAGWVLPDDPPGMMDLLSSFADHHQTYFRHLAVVLDPELPGPGQAFPNWVERLLREPVPASIRIVLIDTRERPHWSPLCEKLGAAARVIEAPIDLFDLARDIAAQSGGGGPQATYRQLLTGVMALLERGSAAQVAQRAREVLRITQQQGWLDQQVVIHSMIAGAWLKENAFEKSLTHYRHARHCAETATEQGQETGKPLVMQSRFGEAGVWLKAGRPLDAARTYAQAAQAAAAVPDPFFVIEGYRMAGVCYRKARKRSLAIDHHLLAVEAALPLPAEQRVNTTLPLVLQALMEIHHRRRARALERYAEIYQARIAKITVRAERRAAALKTADPPAVARIEADMHTRYEKAFARAGKNREYTIAGGDRYFQRLVATGRRLLHPTWNGVPDIRHPLDKEIGQWSDPPALTDLPDPGDLRVAGTVPPAPAVPARRRPQLAMPRRRRGWPNARYDRRFRSRSRARRRRSARAAG
jgi:tetratricopeptide (TPR) repeat protein